MLEITVDTREIMSALTAAPGQLKYAASQGINMTAFDVRGGVKKEMPAVFDRPTPFTQNSLKVYAATQSNLTAEINFKGKPSDHYLQPEVFGGPRPQKMFEKLLGNMTFPGGERTGRFLIPGKGAPLDQYGNVSGGQIMRILAVLGAGRSGQNQTTGSAKRKMRTNSGYKEFVVIRGNIYERVPVAGGGLSNKAKKGLKPGVYQKGADGGAVKATGLKLWFFKADKAPQYKPLLKFDQISKRIVEERLPDNMRKAISLAFKRAGR